MSSTGWWVAGLSAVALVLLQADTPIPARWALLHGLHPQARRRFLALLRRIEQQTGWTVVLTSGYRPHDTGLGYHYFGLGLDLNLEKNGVALRMASPKATWEASGVPALIRAAGFRWGGDFQTTPYDPVHIDLGRTYSLSTLRTHARLRAGSAPLSQFDGRTIPLAS